MARRLSIVLQWLSNLFYVVRNFKSLERLIGDRTTIDVDIHTMRGKCTIILIGKYRNVDYIQTYEVRNSDFDYLVKLLRDMTKDYGILRRVDAMPSIRASVIRETL